MVSENRLRRLVLVLVALVLALAALGMAGGMWLYLVQTGHLRVGDALNVSVPDAEGTTPGAPVEMAGVNIGSVTRTSLSSSGAVLSLGLKSGVNIPRGSRFLVASPLLDPPGGVRIIPPAGAAARGGGVTRPEDGPQVGESGPTLAASMAQANILLAQMTEAGRQMAQTGHQADRLMGDADRVTRRVGTTVQYVNGVVADRRLRGGVMRTLDNAQTASANGVQVTRQMQALLAQTQTRSQALLTNLTQASAQAAATARDSRAQIHDILVDVHKTTGAVSGLTVKTTQLLQSPPAIKTVVGIVNDLQTTLGNLKSTSDHLNALTASGAKLADDPQVQIDLKETLHNIRDMTVKTNTLLDAVTKLAQAAKH